jgi:hypothetical protein
VQEDLKLSKCGHSLGYRLPLVTHIAWGVFTVYSLFATMEPQVAKERSHTSKALVGIRSGYGTGQDPSLSYTRSSERIRRRKVALNHKGVPRD